jgi:hypothetical protein
MGNRGVFVMTDTKFEYIAMSGSTLKNQTDAWTRNTYCPLSRENSKECRVGAHSKVGQYVPLR